MTRRRDPLADFPAFVRSVGERLEAGAKAYGNRSFSRAPMELLGEIEQELLDTAGWAYIAYERLRSMRAALSTVGPLRPSGAEVARTATAPVEKGEAMPRAGAPMLLLGPHAVVLPVIAEPDGGYRHAQPMPLSRVPAVGESMIVQGTACRVDRVLHTSRTEAAPIDAIVHVTSVPALPEGS